MISEHNERWTINVGAFCLHTAIVYISAFYVAPWLVGRLFLLFAALGSSSSVPAPDWYLRHLILATATPALILGVLQRQLGNQSFSASRRLIAGYLSIANWAWLIPTLILAYKLMSFSDPSGSVLGSENFSAIRYYFGVQQAMPSEFRVGGSDPIRVLSQMTVTAPFVAGVGYSLGAAINRKRSSQEQRT